MERYERPIISLNEDLAEGVYAASGDGSDGEIKCDSKYMNGVWQAQDHSDWWVDGVEIKRGYKQQFGCLGCPANTGNGCGIATGEHYDQSGNALSYETDDGNRMPSWERKGYGPDDIAYDFDM